MLRVAPVAALRAAALRAAPVAAPRCVAPRFPQFLRLLLLRAAALPGGGRRQRGGQRAAGAGAAGIGGGFGADRREREETAQFQEYVRRRLDEIGAKMPQPLGAQEAMEADFLEEQVIEYQMSSKRRKMRDPLRDVAESEITHTNLPLLCRFVSESGAIPPRKLTGVSAEAEEAHARDQARAGPRAHAQDVEAAAVHARVVRRRVLAARATRSPARGRRLRGPARPALPGAARRPGSRF